MANNARFTPIRGNENQILNQPKINGQILFTKDTGKIFLDINDKERILVGNSGVSLFYTNEENVRENSESETDYILTYNEIENYPSCHIDDLILNQADGSFYRVNEIDTDNNDVYCTRLSVSGSGGGEGTLARKMSIKAVQEEVHGSIINGQTANAIITVKSDTDDYGEPANTDIAVQWNIYVSGSTVPYLSGSFVVKHGVPFTFEYGTRLHESTTSDVKFSATDSNGTIYTKGFTVSTIELSLTESTTFSKTSLYNNTTDFKLACNIKGLISKKLIFSIDGEEKDVQILPVTSTGTIQSKAIALTHGSHKAKIELYSYDNNIQGAGPEPLEFEFAYVEAGNPEPIIWLGSYNDVYYSYDKIQIPYLAYDPTNPTSAEVKFFKGSAELESKRTKIDWSTGTVSFHYLEITDATIDAQNLYTIMCGTTQKNIVFECKTDPNRDMTVHSDGLLVKFDASGRSNNESSVNREIWKYDYVSATNPENNRTYTGKFDGFNWYNNGWVLDSNNNTCLRISNGAKFSINLGNIDINTNTEGKKACTFEFEFKIKNIQNYEKVIKEITRYKPSDKTGISANDDNAYAAFLLAQAVGKADNYDYWLTQLYSGDNQNYINAKYTNIQAYINPNLSYDDLVIASVAKIRNPSVAFAKYFGNTGFCLGSQDGFFFDGKETINVKYVEDQLINLAIVFDKNAKLIIFYLNGVMSSVSSIESSEIITLDGEKLEFISTTCDIDLYKFRVYNKALDVKTIDINYAVDHRNVLYYDQSNVLAAPNSALNGEYQLTYESMLKFNKDHPHDYLMPYIIFDTTNATKDNGGLGAGVLPYRKSKKINGVHATFVNTGLEYAYENGQLGQLAIDAGYKDIEGGLSAIQQYYMHHCPSWTSKWPTTTDGATIEVAEASNQAKTALNMAVQGTSSEFYPRRNYKLKTKGLDKDGADLIYMYMNRGPFTETYLKDPETSHLDWFYFDNDIVGTTKFTFKVDYMESSGTYNMGFANFVKNAYTKHPLYDYNKAGAFEIAVDVLTPATNFDENADYVFVNYKGNTKNAKEEGYTITADNFAEGPNYFITDENKKLSADKNIWQTNVVEYEPTEIKHLEDYRTSVQGFPVLAFHKNGDKITFIGRYNMLLDKGADEAYGFKLNKKILGKFLKHKKVRDKVECWEFSDNSRTWCSYNDPLGRSSLSFALPADGSTSLDNVYTVPQQLNEPETGGIGGAPYVANSFEYRYHKHSDLLDYFYDTTAGGIELKKKEIIDENTNEKHIWQAIKKISDPDIEDSWTEYDYTEYGDLEVQENRNKAVFEFYKNWEKACKWLYSTRTTNQPSQNAFAVDSTVTAETFDPNKHYIKTNEVQYESTIIDGVKLPFDKNAAYFKKIETEDAESGLISISYEYVANLTAEEYEANEYFLANKTGYKKATEFNPREIYYVADFSYQDSKYLLAEPIKIGNITYQYDTKEYRLAVFKRDLSKHFDLEYCLVYFLMTEIFMCYDSRGKNCMMASWGPLEMGGDYIWYPIFYDIDTQLGINNTGIPSFEYYVNATEEGCFSTNDSVLWMNLYEAFFPEIKAKYFQLRGANGGIKNVHNNKITTPLVGAASASIEDNLDDLVSTVQHIEKWYLADSNECNSISMRGARPLIALNLDEYYKYISITNKLIGHQDRDGNVVTDGGSYFYALQGDRSLSRQQFLSNRINFIDSWMNFGEYARGGSAIFGRIGANNAKNGGTKVYSDYWLDTLDTSKYGTPVDSSDSNFIYDAYYDEKGNKKHYLDADVSVKLTPYQHSYVAIGGDNGISASKQYNGKVVELELPSSVVNGRLYSANYGEQLFYIYGTKSLQDIGDMSTLYWTEFYANKSPKLQKLLLGNNYPGFFNKSMNYPNFDADEKSTYGKPLLEEVNIDNITLTAAAGKYTFDFSSSEKLKHFEALGSNITGVTFASGVALDTLYLPETVNTLKLIEARRLTNVIKERPMPATESEYLIWDKEAHKGIYLEGVTNLIDSQIDNTKYTPISTYQLVGGNLGYGSYDILNTLYKLKLTSAASENTANTLAISLIDVNWTPYTQLVEGDNYDSDYNYFIDNRHYHLDTYNYNAENWNKLILDGRLYKILKTASIPITIQSTELLDKLAAMNQFTNTNSTGSTAIPIITGVVYIDNNTNIEESSIRNGLLENYPDLQVFFTNITKARSANFISINEETGAETLVATQKVSLVDSATWFAKNPYTEYAGKISRNHWVFKGWSTVKDDADSIISQEEWENQTFTDDELDYNFYAVFEHETYTVEFYDGDGNIFDTQRIVYGNFANTPAVLPTKTYSEEEELANMYGGYNFKCYSLSPNSSNEIVLSSYPITSNTIFYAVFNKVDDLRKYPHYEDFFEFTPYSYIEDEYSGTTLYNTEGYMVTPAKGKILSGKVVIPAKYKNQPVVAMSGFSNSKITHLFFEPNSEMRLIYQFCFHSSNDSNAVTCETLKQFEFVDSIRMIGASAFRNVPLEPINNVYELPSNLYSLGTRCFLNAFHSKSTVTIKISSSVIVMDYFSFANHDGLPQTGGNSIIIGTANNKSNLDLSKAYYNSTNAQKRIQFGGFTSIVFYSNIYRDRNDKAYGDWTVSQCLDPLYGGEKLSIL